MADSANSTYGSQYKGRELHVSDGTLTGTSLLKDLNPGEADLPASNLGAGMSHVWWNDVLYFPLDDGTDEHGQELWRTDGTENGTYMVKDIREGSVASSVSGLTLWEDHIYFSALANNSVGHELWKSDGTEAGTVLVKDIYPGDSWQDSSWPRYLTVFNDKLYFQAKNIENGTELWTTDGTENGTTLVVDLRPGTMGNGEGFPSNPSHITVFNDYMYFSATNETVSNGLWKSDGTAEGTSLVKDAYPGSNSNIRSIVPSSLRTLAESSLDKFGIMGDHFYFTAQSCSSTRCANLWKSDGTEEGTVAVTDFDEDSNGENAQGIMHQRIGFVIGESKMVFVVDNETYGEELWISDGTTEGTHLLIDLNPEDDTNGRAGDSDIHGAVAGSGDIFYFGGRDGEWCSHCEEHPNVLWKTDGTVEGTVKINQTYPKPDYPNPTEHVGLQNYPFFPFGNHLVFLGYTSCSGGGGSHHPGCQVGFWILHNISSGFSPTPSYSVYENEVLEPITFDYAEAYREEMVYKGSGDLYQLDPIFPGGADDSSPQDMVVMGDIAYFTAQDEDHGRELWRSGGTNETTALVKDICPGSTGSEIYHGLTVFNDLIIFSANDCTNGEELWISDGTENGTVMIKDMNEGDESSDSDPLGFLDAGDFAYFSGSNASGRELWKTDGTTNGTVLVKDIVSDGSSNPGQLTLFGDTVFFTVGADISSELWKTDGTEEGTIQVSSSVSDIRELTVMGDALYFRGRSSGNDIELWKTDGTTAGTVRVKDINPGNSGSTPQALTVAGGTLFFNANDGTHGEELWKSDGTEDGTVLVKDISSGGSSIIEMVSIGNIVYFRATDGSIGHELWRSDGTEDGTYLVKDIAPGWESSHPQQMTPIGDRLFFTADDGDHGDEFWISDGTTNGTVMFEISVDSTESCQCQQYNKVGNSILFTATSYYNNIELWSFDPTEILYHSIEGMRWSITPSLPEGLSLDSSTGKITGIPTEVIDWTDYTVTLTASNPETGSYFYNGNGSSWMVKDIWSGTGSSVGCCTPFGIAYDNNFYFAAEDGTHGVELWKSDGTAAGTVMVKDIDTTGSDDSDPEFFTVMDNILYFIATTYSSNDELWRSDGTEEGTFMVKDIRNGSQGSYLSSLTIMGNNLYFQANDGVHGRELWKSDGTEAGTVIVKDIWSGSSSSDAGASITAIGDTIFFQARDGTGNGQELWKSDGTANGTVMVKDIRSGGDGSFPRYFTAVGNTLYFRADDGIHGQELWKSDGTANGTVMVLSLIHI